MAPKFIERLFGVRRERFDIKAAAIPLTTGYISPYAEVTWLDTSWESLSTRGYRNNSAVFSCISTLALGYNEPPPVVMLNGDPDAKHPLQKLLNRPNPVMSHAELMTYSIVYRAVGGNCYLHKVRNKAGVVVELWPYHQGQMWPIPSRYGWVESYGYRTANGGVESVPSSEVIHLKWPSIDLDNPIMALPPLLAVAREVDTDSELTRYLYALINNDATPRTVLNVKGSLSDLQFERLRQQFGMRHGGDNRGGVGVVEGEASVTRMSLNLQELAFESLRRVPESRIAGAFRVPAILAGLYVGLEKATYSNYKEARSQLTEDTFVPLWRSDAVELTQALAAEFDSNPDRLVVTYDTGKVAALQENEDAKYIRVVSGYDAGLLMKNEARGIIGLPPVQDVQRTDPEGDVFKSEMQAPMPQPQIIDALVSPPQLTDDQKRYPYPVSLKAKRDESTETLQERMTRELEAYLKAQYEAAAAQL